jgi:hypothetical protein
MTEPAVRAWAMRTSRDSPVHRAFVRSELAQGRLRQGWGSHPEQDLRLIHARIKDPAVGWAGLTETERGVLGHARIVGEPWRDFGAEVVLEGDLILIPNVPEDGLFALCRVTGPYRYATDAVLQDFGHIRPIDLLTPQGVSARHELVSSGLQRSLLCRSRMWWIGDHEASLRAVLSAVGRGDAAALRIALSGTERATLAVGGELTRAIDTLATTLGSRLSGAIQGAEWEFVLQKALAALPGEVTVQHTGGPSERGADLEIHIPNPFAPGRSWVVAVQVKDYDWQVGAYVAAQLEQAIVSRREGENQLIAVVLASTRAAPSSELEAAMQDLSKRHGVPVTCCHGQELMRLLASGLLAGHLERAAA